VDTLRNGARVILSLALTILLPAGAGAQLVSLRSVPVASGDQFFLFPSERQAMGGVSIALRDRLLDPFSNPATGSRLETGYFFASPTYYGITNENGSGRTLPVGGLFVSDAWFGGVAFSLQQLKAGEADEPIALPVFEEPPPWLSSPVPIWTNRPLSQESANNLYAFGLLGRKLGRGDLSIGGSLFWAGLDALDGVEHLYSGSQAIEQDGHIVDVRFGLVGDWEDDRSLELVLVHNRIDMSHEVSYVDWFTPPNRDWPVPYLRVDKNLDQTNTWGVHGTYVHPLRESGWKIGGLFTANRKTHPKIPNYEIQNIPRDPGDTWAYNLGVGVSRAAGPATVGFDVVLEPIWSETWQEAEDTIPAFGGGVILPGKKTIENEFVFTNAFARMGFGLENDRGGVQAGVVAHSISYELEQYDNVVRSRRDQNEDWVEWTFSWGGVLRLPEIELRYLGRVTSGTGRPGVNWSPGFQMDAPAADALSQGNFILAPSGPLTLQDASVHTHQLSIVIPLR
jgi:hypothetical protein